MSTYSSRVLVVLVTFFLFCTIQCLASSSLRGSNEKVAMMGTGENIIPNNSGIHVVDHTANEEATLTMSIKQINSDKKGGNLKLSKEEEEQRKLNVDTVARLFATPIAQWTLAQWGLLFILIWLAGYFLRRCPCIYDLLACFCCYELFCDPDPVGFFSF